MRRTLPPHSLDTGRISRRTLMGFGAALPLAGMRSGAAGQKIVIRWEDGPEKISGSTSQLEFTINKTGYVSGVAAQSFVDKKTGFRDPGFGLDIVDWIMEPGSDEAYRDQLDKELVYEFGNLVHGSRPKRSIEGPQICTQAKTLKPRIVRGNDLRKPWLGIKSSFEYRTAAPGKKTGSLWEQTLVFPEGERFFLSSDRITTVNGGKEMFLRLDMPGHIKHHQGDTFSQVYLSYLPGNGLIPSSEYLQDFAPDQKFLYVRNPKKLPKRMIRAYRLRDPKSGADGPWLAGMTLNPAVVTEAWSHQRGYVCMIEEFGLLPEQPVLQPGEAFSAAFLVGYFDSIGEMHRTYDRYQGAVDLTATTRDGWKHHSKTVQPTSV